MQDDRQSSSIVSLSLIGFDTRGFRPHTVRVRRTHPRGEVGFRFKVLPKVLVAFEVAEVGLQGEGCQEEVGLLPLDALREQHLFPQVPVVVVPGNPVTAGDRWRRRSQTGLRANWC